MLRAIYILLICFLYSSFLLSQNAQIEAHSPSCKGLADGDIEVKIANPHPSAVLRLMDAKNNRLLQTKNLNSDTLALFKNLAEGSYIVQLILQGEPENFSVKIESPFELKAEYIEIVEVKGSSDLAKTDLRLTCSGGKPPYSVKWTENACGQTGELIKELNQGIYTCYLTDKNNCGPKSATFFLFEDEIAKFNQTKNSINETSHENNSHTRE